MKIAILAFIIPFACEREVPPPADPVRAPGVPNIVIDASGPADARSCEAGCGDAGYVCGDDGRWRCNVASAVVWCQHRDPCSPGSH